jgi:hypothetical protein
MTHGRELSALRAANDSEMAPQAIEKNQNGLGQIRGSWSLGRRIDQAKYDGAHTQGRRKIARKPPSGLSSSLSEPP